MMIQDYCCEDHCRAVRCYEDRAWCRSCPERCYPDDEPMEAKEPTPLDRFTHALSQWVSRSWLPGLARISKAMQRVKKE